MRRRRHPSVPRAALSALAAGALCLSCSQEPLQTTPKTPPPDGAGAPSSEFVGVEVTEEDADGTRWRVTAESGSAWERDGSGTLKGVRAVFERGKGRVSLTAGQGQIEERRTVRLSGGVRVEWGQFSAELENATYHRGQGMVRSQAPVVFRGPGLEVRGKGLEVDVEGRRARIPAGVRATLSPAAGT